MSAPSEAGGVERAPTASDVVVPALSESNPDSEGVVATWFVREGETVATGQLIAEIAVDKVSIEVPAPAGGTVHLLASEEEVVHPGQVIARIDVAA